MVTLAPNFRICAPVNTADWFWPFLFFMGVFDLLILLLSLLESIRFFFASYQLVAKGSLVPKFSSTGWKSQTHIFQIFLRDSVLFPFLGFATCIVSLLAWLRIVKPSAIQITIILTTMAPPILGCRLILNLREAYYKPFEDECRTALIFADLPSSTQSQPPSPGISSLTPVSTNDSNC
ncbi:hypothetical protein CC2G_003355 [Coprinopsis cinerea AmutBmut pab1-1]|nr:hypothetical protein CC2G_003355 [Coprinopsis cinerea AmutBmut pab1-1]